MYVFDSQGRNTKIIEGIKSRESGPFQITPDGEYAYQWSGTWIWGSLSIYSLEKGERIFRDKAGTYYYDEGENRLVYEAVKDEGIPYALPDEVREVRVFSLETQTAETLYPAEMSLDESRVLTIESPRLTEDGPVEFSTVRYSERSAGSNKFFWMD